MKANLRLMVSHLMAKSLINDDDGDDGDNDEDENYENYEDDNDDDEILTMMASHLIGVSSRPDFNPQDIDSGMILDGTAWVIMSMQIRIHTKDNIYIVRIVLQTSDGHPRRRTLYLLPDSLMSGQLKRNIGWHRARAEMSLLVLPYID